MIRKLPAAILTVASLSCVICQAEEISSKEFGFTVQTPEGDAWKILQNDVIGQRNPTYFLKLVDLKQVRTLVVMAGPLPKQRATGKPTTTLDEMKDGWEKGLLKKAERKISSADVEVSGHKGYQVVALVKTPTGEERHFVVNLVVANGRAYEVGGMTKGPWDEDKELEAFVKSFQIQNQVVKSDKP